MARASAATGPRRRRRPRLFAVALLAFMAVPDAPARFWYAIPEQFCDWFHSDEDQWQCDGQALDTFVQEHPR